MSVPKASGDFGQVVSINSFKHELSIDILIGIVNPAKVPMVHANYECTDMLHDAVKDTLKEITPDGTAYFETFKKVSDLEKGVAERIRNMGRNMVLKADNDTRMGFVASAPAPFPN